MVASMTANPDFQRLVGDIVRPGLIASVDHAAARCTVEIGDIVTGPLPWIAFRAGRARIWSPPSVGEQCLLICAEGDAASGFVLPAIYSAANPAPSNSGDAVLIAFEDGSVIGYDMAAHALTVTLADGSATIDAPGGITINGPLAVTGDVTVDGGIEASDDVTGGGVSLKSHRHSGVQAGGAQTGAPA